MIAAFFLPVAAANMACKGFAGFGINIQLKGAVAVPALGANMAAITTGVGLQYVTVGLVHWVIGY